MAQGQHLGAVPREVGIFLVDLDASMQGEVQQLTSFHG
jgi:hypothetical protein